ncbi:MAG TPA: alpha/beta hydrolase [Ktedonobacteraceae bacterium]
MDSQLRHEPHFTPAKLEETSALVARDLAYAQVSAAQKLDLYLPGAQGLFPLVIYVHGGAFKFGDKGDNEATGAFPFLLASGYALASINYRLSGEARFPAQIHDVKTAVRWLRTNAINCHIDPARIGAWGASAGGHLVSLLATSGDAAELEGAELGHAEQSSRIQAVVSWYAPIDFLHMDAQLMEDEHCGPAAATHNQPDSPESELLGAPIQTIPELVRTTNPITYVHRDVPPFLIEHGTADYVVPARQAQQLHDALVPLIGAGNVELVYLPGARHADAIFPSSSNMQRVVQFFERHLR